MPTPTLDELLDAAVAGVGGTTRPGQVRMAHAVADAITKDEHLIVQAGTGTGKSLAYLVPAIAHAQKSKLPVVVATATLALQAQIVDRDLPRLARALAPVLGRTPTFAIVKGRRNYVCVRKLDGGFPDEDEEGLFGMAQAGREGRDASWLGKEVLRAREWANETESGDRDELVPGVPERAWRQLSVDARECLGSKCPAYGECFVEQARERAKDVDIIVTNHAFMAIDAFEDRHMLPEHKVLVVDEAHELVDRVTGVVTDEISGGIVTSAARKAGKQSEQSGALEEAGEMLGGAMGQAQEGRMRSVPEMLGLALARVRDTARAVLSDLKGDGKDGDVDGARQVARAAVSEVHDTAERILEGRDLDVVWLTADERRGSMLHVAPMSVAMSLRDHLFGERTVVLTSATIELGGSFDAVAGQLGLRGEGAPEWTGLDVGSPFDYPKQAIAYVAAQLPAPGRDGLAEQTLAHIAELITAAGGRTLALFSSMRAAQQATEAMRERLPQEGRGAIPVLCQGDDQLATLVRQFAREPRTCLFGTMSLWQGVDVPGSACQLVLIDRIPFPRPDDPLSSARTEAIGRMGGNGFMAVSATHAALRLAQGAGRLVRRGDDRGVVAFLDSRMMTARYAGFLQRSLPPFWPTTDTKLVLGALQRLDATADPVLPVADPPKRGLAGHAAESVAGALVDAGDRRDADDAGGEADSGVDEGPVAEGPPVAESSRTAVTGGHAWTAEMDDELRDAVDAEIELDELAEHFELPEDAIAARIEQLGL